MELTIDQFIRSFNIKPADAIRMKKKSFGMLDHYVLYIGIYNNCHKFIANYTKGVEVIPDQEITDLVQVLQPSAVEAFPGTDYQRQFALQRAYSRVGEKSYGLITNNCEHFKNFVHYGEDTSRQVEALGGGMIFAGITTALIGTNRKDPVLACAGILAALLGAFIYQNEKKTIANTPLHTHTLQ